MMTLIVWRASGQWALANIVFPPTEHYSTPTEKSDTEIIPTRIICQTSIVMSGSNPDPASSPAPVDSPDRRRLPPLLRRAWYGLNQAFRRRIAHTCVTPDQFTVMRILLEGDPKGITQRELTQIMSSDPNTIASLLERMESAGWVERQPHERDRRAYRIRLLNPGKRKYTEVREVAVDLQSQVLSVLPEHKREEFLENLAIVADSCRVAAVRDERVNNRD
jgi:DNA-binding MarR family transcriptional regulator